MKKQEALRERRYIQVKVKGIRFLDYRHINLKELFHTRALKRP